MIRINQCNTLITKHMGMTLIELLIVITTIGVLSAIAYPSYQAHVLKSHRSAVMSDMIKVQMKLEQHRTQTGSYDYTIIDNSTGDCDASVGCQNDTNRYKLSITSGASGINLYIIKAVPQAKLGQTKDKCGSLSMNAGSVGSAEKNGISVDGCWN